MNAESLSPSIDADVAAGLARVLILHNRYRQPGGEDVVVAAQAELLRKRGHAVHVLEKDNSEIDSYGFFRKALLFFEMSENARAAAEVEKIVHEFKPDVAIVHNFLPLLSPSIYKPLKRNGVKVVQYLHNYRLVCAAGTLYRDGKACSLCVDDGLKHAVANRCWNDSKIASLGVTRMLDRHRRAQTWHTDVDLFVTLNGYQRELLVNAGVIPAARTIVHPNFLASDEAPPEAGVAGEGFMFAGRLMPEKGVQTLLNAHATLKDVRLTIFGDGPLRDALMNQYTQPGVEFPGHRPRAEVRSRMVSARAVIVPSEWPEVFGLTAIEAMALGRPVIASRVAGPREIVEDKSTGLLFDPGNSEQLADCMRHLNAAPDVAVEMGRAGRARYEKLYDAEAGYRNLQDVFQRAGVK